MKRKMYQSMLTGSGGTVDRKDVKLPVVLEGRYLRPGLSDSPGLELMTLDGLP